MNTKEIHLLVLTYDITFNDSDDGRCYAGSGKMVLGAYADATAAKKIADEYNPILALAEGEHIVYPMQRYSKMLKNKLGFTPSDMGQDNENYKFIVESYEVNA